MQLPIRLSSALSRCVVCREALRLLVSAVRVLQIMGAKSENRHCYIATAKRLHIIEKCFFLLLKILQMAQKYELETHYAVPRDCDRSPFNEQRGKTDLY